MYGTTLVACLSQSCPSGGQRCEICVGIQKPLQTSRQTACNTPLSKNRALSRAHNSSRPISGTKTNFLCSAKKKKKEFCVFACTAANCILPQAKACAARRCFPCIVMGSLYLDIYCRDPQALFGSYSLYCFSLLTLL